MKGPWRREVWGRLHAARLLPCLHYDQRNVIGQVSRNLSCQSAALLPHAGRFHPPNAQSWDSGLVSHCPLQSAKHSCAWNCPLPCQRSACKPRILGSLHATLNTVGCYSARPKMDQKVLASPSMGRWRERGRSIDCEEENAQQLVSTSASRGRRQSLRAILPVFPYSEPG